MNKDFGFPSEEDLKKNKCFFYSKASEQLLIEVEKNEVAYTYWTFKPLTEDVAVFESTGVTGSKIITHAEGDAMIQKLKTNTLLIFEDNIVI